MKNRKHITKPASLVRTTIENAGMATSNGYLTPFDYILNLRAPDAEDDKVPHVFDNFRQLIGNLRYLTDSTRPELGYITSKLCMAMHTPTTRLLSEYKLRLFYTLGRS